MKGKGKKILTAVLILIAVASISYIVYYFVKKEENNKVYEEMQKQVNEEVEQQEEPEQQNEDPVTDAEKPQEVVPIDFPALQETNSDIYAWVEVPGTNINYPIVQSATDDIYYLNHTIDGKEGLPGSIYTESKNAKDFSDFATVIYGHNMNDGTMFKNLHKYEDPEFIRDNSEVVIYTPEKKLTYKIFAAVQYDDRHIIDSYDFTVEQQKKDFLDSILSVRTMNSNIKEDVAVDVNSNIIILSTCIANQPDNRYLVGAVLVNE